MRIGESTNIPWARRRSLTRHARSALVFERRGVSMKLFVLHDPQGKENETKTVVVRAESERRAREVAADQEESWKWRDGERTTCESIPPDGASGVVWFEP